MGVEVVVIHAFLIEKKLMGLWMDVGLEVCFGIVDFVQYLVKVAAKLLKLIDGFSFPAFLKGH